MKKKKKTLKLLEGKEEGAILKYTRVLLHLLLAGDISYLEPHMHGFYQNLTNLREWRGQLQATVSILSSQRNNECLEISEKLTVYLQAHHQDLTRWYTMPLLPYTSLAHQQKPTD